jgi:hypothetical protein
VRRLHKKCWTDLAAYVTIPIYCLRSRATRRFLMTRQHSAFPWYRLIRTRIRYALFWVPTTYSSISYVVICRSQAGLRMLRARQILGAQFSHSFRGAAAQPSIYLEYKTSKMPFLPDKVDSLTKQQVEMPLSPPLPRSPSHGPKLKPRIGLRSSMSRNNKQNCTLYDCSCDVAAGVRMWNSI